MSRAHALFLKTLGPRRDMLAQYLDSCDETGFSEAAGLCHQIAGTAGSFGYDRLTDLARELDRALRDTTPVADDQRSAAIRQRWLAVQEQIGEVLANYSGGES